MQWGEKGHNFGRMVHGCFRTITHLSSRFLKMEKQLRDSLSLEERLAESRRAYYSSKSSAWLQPAERLEFFDLLCSITLYLRHKPEFRIFILKLPVINERSFPSLLKTIFPPPFSILANKYNFHIKVPESLFL